MDKNLETGGLSLVEVYPLSGELREKIEKIQPLTALTAVATPVITAVAGAEADNSAAEPQEDVALKIELTARTYETIERYARIANALESTGLLRRILNPQSIKFYDIRLEGKTIGLGSLLLNQTIEHPAVGQVTGTDMDYCLLPESHGDEDIHAKVAVSLINQNNLFNGFSRRRPAFASVPVSSNYPAIGFSKANGLINDSGCVGVIDYIPAGKDDVFEVAKQNKLVDFYSTQ